MRILVLGAGVVGVTTAWYLRHEGHEVTVIERQPRAAMESSFGNAGGLCPAFAGPWAAPGMIGKVLRMSLDRHAPIRFSLWPNAERIRWAARWAGNCRLAAFRANKARMQRIAHYSQACLDALIDDESLGGFDFHRDGTLQLFSTERELELGQLATRTLAELGIPWRMLGPAELSSVEPALKYSQAVLTGGLHLPTDASGDSHKFCAVLTARLKADGVVFRFGESLERIEVQGGEVSGVRVSPVGAQDRHKRLVADAYVVALGSHAPAMLRPLGLALPVYPLKGYSITVPVTDAARVPTVALMDEHHKIMVSRLGDRLRVAGMAELVGHDLRQPADRRELLTGLARRLVPGGLDYGQLRFWAGLRPMTPDGPPVLGPTRIGKLFLNSGHGSNGWTQACGTSRIVADMITGRTPAIDTEGLTGERFGLGGAATSAPLTGRAASTWIGRCREGCARRLRSAMRG